MYRVIWEYKVKPKAISKFEVMYGSKGEWVKFFKASKAYQGSELLLDDESELIYITMDFWESEEAYNDFLKANKEKFEILNQKGKAFTKSEKRIWA